MSRKHFAAIAEALRVTEQHANFKADGDLFQSQWAAAYARDVRVKVACELASLCPDFNIDRFMKAATFVPAT